MDASREMERRPGVLAVSIFQTQPWMDLPEIGWSVEVVTDGDREPAQADADELARTGVVGPRGPPRSQDPDRRPRSTRRGRRRRRPVVFADGADSTSAGGNGDGTELLAALLERPSRSTRC